MVMASIKWSAPTALEALLGSMWDGPQNASNLGTASGSHAMMLSRPYELLRVGHYYQLLSAVILSGKIA